MRVRVDSWADVRVAGPGADAGGAHAVEHLQAILGEVQVADIRSQVALSLIDDVHDGALTPTPRHHAKLDALLDQLAAWAARCARCAPHASSIGGAGRRPAQTLQEAPLSVPEAPSDRLSRPMPQWWLILLSGVVAVITGIVAVAVPGLTLLVVGLFFGISLIVTGAGSIVVGVSGLGNPGSQVLAVLVGFISVAAGLFCLARPGAGILAVLFSVAFWFVLIGIGDLATAFRDPESRAWRGLLGVIGIVAGIVLLANPGVGLSTVALLAGLGFLLRGGTEIVLALQTRKLEEALRPR